MAITIELSEASEKRLAERAARYGRTPEDFAAKVLNRELKARSLDDDLAPFRQDDSDPEQPPCRQILILGEPNSRAELIAIRKDRTSPEHRFDPRGMAVVPRREPDDSYD